VGSGGGPAPTSHQRLAIRRTPPEIIPEQGYVAHLWHIKKLESAGRRFERDLPSHVCAGQTPRVRPHPVRNCPRAGPCGTFVAQRECDRREQQRGARGRPMSGLGWRACPRIRLAGLSGGQQIPPFSCLRAVHSGLRLRHQQGGVPARDGGDRAPDRFGPTKQGPRTSPALRR
jgi:hypothetical protein